MKAEAMLVRFEVDARAVEADAFGFQEDALFEALFTGEEDLTAGSDDPVPGQTVSLAKGPDNLTGASGEACGGRNAAVRGDFTARDAADGGAELGEHLRLAAVGEGFGESVC